MEIKRIIKDVLIENDGIIIKDLKQRDFDIQGLLRKKINKIFTFTGFRRVGKTYLLFLIRENIKNELCIYFNFEDERIPESTNVLTQLLYSVEEIYHKKPGFLFLDEIHIIPGWGKFLRRISDRGFKVFVTGSSSKLGLKEIPTELRGRTLNYTILPLSFLEYLSFKGVESNHISSQKEVELNQLFEQYLIYGGFPELFDSSILERKEVIHEYFRTLVQRDLIERFNLKQEALLRATIKLILNSLMISISKLTNTLKSMGFHCSKNTISNYITYMGKSFFLFQALFYSKNVKDQLQYPRKVYFIDNGFLKFLSINTDKSRLLENLVAIELKRRGNELYYWRNTRGEEIDFLVFENNRVNQLIQVSFNISLPDTREREFRSLKKGMKHFGLKKGIILTMGPEELIEEEDFKIHVIPVIKWLLNYKE